MAACMQYVHRCLFSYLKYKLGKEGLVKAGVPQSCLREGCPHRHHPLPTAVPRRRKKGFKFTSKCKKLMPMTPSSALSDRTNAEPRSHPCRALFGWRCPSRGRALSGSRAWPRHLPLSPRSCPRLLLGHNPKGTGGDTSASPCWG